VLLVFRQGIVVPVKEPSVFVTKILQEVFKLPHSLRLTYLAQSTRLIARKAVALIKYVESEL